MVTGLVNSAGLIPAQLGVLQCNPDSKYLELVQTSQDKGKVLHKTTPTSDSSQMSEVGVGVLQATHNSDQLATSWEVSSIPHV